MRNSILSQLKCTIALACVATLMTGCTSMFAPIDGVPSHRLPNKFLAQPKNDLHTIDISRLRQPAPTHYLVDAGDVLGIYIEGVLGTATEAPPILLQDAASDRPPAIGYPIPIREDGSLSLPLIEPLKVNGLTLNQVESAIKRAYTDAQILKEDVTRIVVTLMKERTYSVIVVREDGMGGEGGLNLDQRGRGETVKLDAYKNDVLHALAATGGLPGRDARNVVRILRGNQMTAAARDQFVTEFYANNQPGPCEIPADLPGDPTITEIPLRLAPGQIPTFKPEDVVLNSGDIIMIESRDREVFYTGGLLGGGEYPLPRDYDLDVLGAMAMAGSGLDSRGNNQASNMMNGLGGVPPGQLYVLRNLNDGQRMTISVDLARALRDPKANILIQPGDTLILRYKAKEEAVNFGIGTFFTWGIADMVR